MLEIEMVRLTDEIPEQRGVARANAGAVSELARTPPLWRVGEQENDRITIDGTNITPTTQARILGVIFQNNGKAGASITKIKVSTE